MAYDFNAKCLCRRISAGRGIYTNARKTILPNLIWLKSKVSFQLEMLID